MTTQQREFLRTVGETIRLVAKQRGYNFPSAIIAQAALETGWGQTPLAKRNNFFGMKTGSKWKGKVVRIKTWEEVNGRAIQVYADFRAYDTITEGVQGYFDFISTTRYKNLKSAVSPTDYVQKIKADGWATDSKYVTKLLQIINANNLTAYDGVVPEISLDQIALQVIAGAWGNGEERKQRLTAAGYDYKEVQSIVNKMLKG